MKIGAIIQARVSSSRFPEKILKSLPYDSDLSVLAQVIKRLKFSKKIDKIIIATTFEKKAKKINYIAKKENVKYFRGDTKDVLSRYYWAAKKNEVDIIVRISSDCPCIDAAIVDSLIGKHLSKKADYTSNTIKRTYPDGFDAEVFNFGILEKAYRNARKGYEREHVSPYIYEHPHIFKIIQLEAPQKFYAPDIRVTLDTAEDYALICAVFDFLYEKNRNFSVNDIIRLFHKKPWLRLINGKVSQKKICYTLESELKEILKIADLQDLKRCRDFIKKCMNKNNYY